MQWRELVQSRYRVSGRGVSVVHAFPSAAQRGCSCRCDVLVCHDFLFEALHLLEHRHGETPSAEMLVL